MSETGVLWARDRQRPAAGADIAGLLLGKLIAGALIPKPSSAAAASAS
jgi:hypothetical protein